jgi:hypothetical protein
MTLCILLINKKSLKPSILNGFQAFYSQKVSKTELYPYFQESKSRFQRLSIMKIGNGMIKKGFFCTTY